ncbi:rhodanese-like domain-containing protein [Methylobacillus glycogenes]|uniref:rhodanese-like domain-containing protein n=1 Tax=Methylobacillus glycogenes TaxID=406 RepID=UPI0004723BCF|nr:rhodanese-like domain-containing protein [Methylobacillus glycogenes]
MDFVAKNALWLGLAVGSGLALLWTVFKRGPQTGVSVSDAVLLINRSNAVVVDIRDQAEFAAGHITDARHIPLADIEKRAAELTKFKTKPVLVVCQSGVRSAKAVAQLSKLGFEQVKQINGGLQAWQEAKLPVVKG